MTAQWDIQHVSFAYKGQSLLLKDLNFQIQAGTFLGIAGPNGVGKTTLIQLLSALLKPNQGKVLLDSKNVHRMSSSALAKRVALVRQHSQIPFGFTVEETVLMARTAHLDWAGFETKTDRDKVREALCLTGVDHLAHRTIHSLSGGECQRVFIARALAQDTDVLILDEPTNYLDLKHQIAVYNLLKTIQTQRNMTIIAITHDINMALQYCDQILLLSQDGQGPKAMIGPAQDVLTLETIDRVFGVVMTQITQEPYTFFVPVRSQDTYSPPSSPPPSSVS